MKERWDVQAAASSTPLLSFRQVQGMSFIAAVLILNLDTEDAFIAFSNLLNKPCQMAFFRVDHGLVSIPRACAPGTVSAHGKRRLPLSLQWDKGRISLYKEVFRVSDAVEGGGLFGHTLNFHSRMCKFLSTFFQKVFPKIRSSDRRGRVAPAQTHCPARGPHVRVCRVERGVADAAAAAPATCPVWRSPPGRTRVRGAPVFDRGGSALGGGPWTGSIRQSRLPASTVPRGGRSHPGGPSFAPEVGPLLSEAQEWLGSGKALGRAVGEPRPAPSAS